jgi:hypothetical protein
LHRILTYKIVRHIICDFIPYNVSYTFPEGNWYIEVAFVRDDHELAENWSYYEVKEARCNYELTKARRFKLDPKAPTEVSLTMTPKNER